MSDNDKLGDLVPIGALWKQEGKKHLKGKLGDANLFIFPNKFKEKDNHPDYKVFVAKPQKKESGDSQSGLAPGANDDFSL